MNTTDLTIEEIKKQCTEQESRIIDMYLNRDTQKTICNSLSISRHTIDRLVKKYGLGRFRDRKLSYCKNINIEEPEFWYFLGLFASDGNLYLKGKSVDTIQFTLDDKDALLHIKDILGCNNEIKEYKRGNKMRWYISISDTNLISTVRTVFGSDCYRKTFSIKFPSISDTQCLSMFLRGFFDGDGSFSVSAIKGFYNFKIYCASKEFAHSLYNTLVSIVHKGVHFYKGSYIEIDAQENVYNLCKFLYAYNPTIGIARKRDRAIQHIRNYELKI
jgi:hypothetical protein